MEETQEKINLSERKDLKVELRSQPSPFHMNGISFLLIMSGFRGESDHHYVLREKDVVLEKDSGYSASIGGPSFHLNRKEAQQLFDDLWISGFRPTEGYKGPEAFVAQGEHLKDMRKMLFNKLGMKDELKQTT